MRNVDHDEIRDAPPTVIGAVAAGVAPLPFLAVYAVLFIARGTVRPVIPPDVGTTKGSELVAGLVALALFILVALAAYWLLDGRRRWLFLLCQVGLLATAVDFLVDPTTGSPSIPALLALTSLAAIVLALMPRTWDYLHRELPGWLRRGGAQRIP
jgi:hypothetical protein